MHPLRHILLVEDDDEMRRLLRLVLARSGFEVTEAPNGRRALEILINLLAVPPCDKPLPDLVITDQRMPGLSGLGLIEAMRLAWCQVPAILITAFGDETMEARADALGGVAVLDKPFEMDALLAMMSRLQACPSP